MCPQKIRKLPRQTVWMDEKGRIVIPKYLREATNMTPLSWVEIAADPELKDMKCKGLTLRRSY